MTFLAPPCLAPPCLPTWDVIGAQLNADPNQGICQDQPKKVKKQRMCTALGRPGPWSFRGPGLCDRAWAWGRMSAKGQTGVGWSSPGTGPRVMQSQPPGCPKPASPSAEVSLPRGRLESPPQPALATPPPHRSLRPLSLQRCRFCADHARGPSWSQDRLQRPPGLAQAHARFVKDSIVKAASHCCFRSTRAVVDNP